MMSKMKGVAALLGVEIIEEFGATGINERFRITDSRFERIILIKDSRFERRTICNEWVEAPAHILYELLTGKRKIIKKPWKPNLREKYYFMCVGGNVCKESWHNSVIDLMNYATGNCFKTKEEAEKRDKAVIARLKKIYADGKPLIGADEWRDKE